MPAVPRRAPRSNTSQLQYLTRHAVVPIHACAHRARCVSPLDQHATSRAPPPYANQRSAPYRVDLARSHTFDSRRGGVLLVDQRLLALSRIGGGARRRAVTVVVARRERGGRAAAGVDAVETRLHVVLDLAREAALVAQRTLRVRALGGAAALLALGRAVADDGRGRHGHFTGGRQRKGAAGRRGDGEDDEVDEVVERATDLHSFAPALHTHTHRGDGGPRRSAFAWRYGCSRGAGERE